MWTNIESDLLVIVDPETPNELLILVAEIVA